MKGQYQLTAKNTLFYSLGNMAGKLSGVILLPLYTLYLNIEEFGLIGLFESTYMLFLILGGMGIKGALMRWYWDKDKLNKQKSIFFSALAFNTSTALIFSVISFFIFLFFSKMIFNTEISENVMILLVFSNFFKVMVDYPQLLQRMQQRALVQTIYQILILVLNVSVTAYLLIYQNFKIDGVLWGQVIAYGVVFFIQLPYLVKNSEPKFEKTEIKEMFHFGYPLFLSSLLIYFLALTDNFIINHYNGLDDSGLYTLATKISTVVNLIFVTSFNQAYVHVFYKNMDAEGMKKFFTKTLNYFTLGISFLSIILILFAKEILQLFSMGNANYEVAHFIVPYLVIGLIFIGINGQLQLPFQKAKLTKIISVIAIMTAALNFIFNFVLIPQYSSIGAATAKVIANVFAMVCYFYFLKKKDIAVVELNKIIKIFVLIVLSLIAFYFVNDIDLILRIAIKTTIIIVFGLIAFNLNIFEKSDIEALKLFVAKKLKRK